MKKRLYFAIPACCAVLMSIFSCGSGNSDNKAIATDAQKLTEKSVNSKHLIVDAANSKIYWTGSMRLKSHHGTLGISNGNLYINGDKLESGDFMLDMNAIFCEDLTDQKMNEQLIKHLKSPDFFNVEKYQEGKFSITKVEDFVTDSTTHRISGNLLLKGIEKNISFDAKIIKKGDTYKAITGTFTIDRTQWDVNYKSKNIFKDLKDAFIEDDIKVSLLILAKETKE